ncbi:MAG: glycosyltransferase family 2 protein [Hyphomonadaceae bacterium]
MTPDTSKPRVVAAQAGLRVSAVIAVGEHAPSLEACLRAILNEPWIDELVIVDAGVNGEEASRMRALQADRRDVRFVETGGATLAKARNVGAARAAGKWVLFLDPDIVIRRGAAERLVKAGRLARSPWIVGGALSDPRGRQRGVTARTRLGRRPAPAERVDGGFLLIPRAEFVALGGFDETYRGHGETRDLCRRARAGGGSVWLQPAAEGVEFEGVRQKSRVADAVARVTGAARYARKFAASPIERAFVLVLAPVFIGAAALKAVVTAPFRAHRPPP